MISVESKSASLETLSVTIQALHVNGKQMTLAVFRQLPIGQAYNSDGSLASFEWWGIVRYEIKDQGSVWVVAGRDGRLYRCSAGHGISTPDYYKWRLRILGEESKAFEEVDAYRAGDRSWVKVPNDYRSDWRERHTSEKTNAEKMLPISEAASNSLATLMKLPQLFIAV